MNTCGAGPTVTGLVVRWKRRTSVSDRCEKGIALITTLLLLVLMSTMIVGIAWLVMGDQKLGGNNGDRQLAFYGAEAGLEALTAQLENTFNSNYAPTSTDIANVIANTPLNLVPGVQYLAPGNATNGSGYTITFPPTSGSNPNPLSSYHTISTAPNAGLVGLTTIYTLTTTGHSFNGSEVKLVRSVQTVAIPIFQFGIFSDTDLSFFAGPSFDFGGRVHTNGNLWLAQGDGGTLTMENKVTAVGEIITSNLENGWSTNSNYNGVVNITTNVGSPSYLDLKAGPQNPNQSASGTTNWVGNVGAYNPSFTAMAGLYNNNVAVGPEPNSGVTALNMAIATPAIGGQAIDIIRRPVTGEDTANPGKLAERYYNQVSLRFLLSDYGPSGGCTDSDISSSSGTKLPHLAPNGAGPTTPIDLANLAWTSTGPPVANGNTTLPYSSAPAWIPAATVGVSVFPLPTSNAQGAGYLGTDGYWIKKYYPIITGCIKIDYQSKASPGTWVDVTAEILKLGWTGGNINPQVNNNGVPALPASPWLQPSLTAEAAGLIASGSNQVASSGPTANPAVSTVGCSDPSINAVLRLAGIRDNPSNAKGGNANASNNFCGNNPSSNGWSGGTNQLGNNVPVARHPPGIALRPWAPTTGHWFCSTHEKARCRTSRWYRLRPPR
jgi:hypothetical protein